MCVCLCVRGRVHACLCVFVKTADCTGECCGSITSCPGGNISERNQELPAFTLVQGERESSVHVCAHTACLQRLVLISDRYKYSVESVHHDFLKFGLYLKWCKLSSMCWNPSTGLVDFEQIPTKRYIFYYTRNVHPFPFLQSLKTDCDYL